MEVSTELESHPDHCVVIKLKGKCLCIVLIAGYIELKEPYVNNLESKYSRDGRTSAWGRILASQCCNLELSEPFPFLLSWRGLED